MYCTQCGQRNPDGSRFCVRCGAQIALADDEPPDASAQQGSYPSPPFGGSEPPPVSTPPLRQVAPDWAPPSAPPAYVAPPARPAAGAQPGSGHPSPPAGGYPPAPPSYRPPQAIPEPAPYPPSGPPPPTWGAAGSGSYGPPAAYTAPIPYGQPVPARAFAYAGFWRRFFALVLDSIVLGLVIGPLSSLLGAGGTSASFSSEDAAAALIAASSGVGLIASLLSVLYYALMESSGARGTLGKLVLGIRVVSLDGQRISFGRALGRNLAKVLSSLVLCIGYLMTAFTEKKQALHDMVAGCLVIRKES